MNEPIYVFAGWLMDGTGEPVRRDMLIRIESGVITSLKKVKRDDLKPIVETIVDLSHCTLLPGLVDCHVHLTMSGMNDPDLRRRQLNLSFEQAQPVISERIAKQIAHGVLALRDGGDSAAHTLRYQSERLHVDKHPVFLKAAGKAWRAKGRYGRLIGRPPEEGHTLAQCVTRQEKTDHIKIINSGLNSLTEFGKETAAQFSRNELEAAVQAARKRNQKVMVHANGRLPVRVAVEAGCDSIEHGFFMGRDNRERMAELQVFWVPTAFSMRAYCEQLPPGSTETEVALRNLDHQVEQIAHARKLGIPVVVGTDSGGLGIRHGRAFVQELKILAEAGFTIPEAVRCATLDGARLLGLQNELGSLKKGMPATFVAVPGDPSNLPAALEAVESVYFHGKQVSRGSRELPLRQSPHHSEQAPTV
jgi:imidazolonepropionase-like amidohydrolase